jgi:hypothetical protein
MQLITKAVVLSLAITAGIALSGCSNTAPYQYSDDEPRFIVTETINSRIGKLEFERGFPTEETAEILFENRTFYRGIEVVTQHNAAASMERRRQAYVEFGAGKANQVIITNEILRPNHEFLTGNSETAYALTFLDMKVDGPTVVEAPAGMLGLVNDMWIRYVADIGVMGPDKGEGGKFLFIPPGYEGDIPDGYHVFTSKTYGAWLVLRSFIGEGGVKEATTRYDDLKIYPLADIANPAPTELINMDNKEIYTVHSENYEFLEELGHLVENEHPDALSKDQKFLLASIGMEFGKPFNPDAKTRKTLEEAAKVGAAQLRANMWDFQGEGYTAYGQWWNTFVGGSHTYDGHGYLDYDGMAVFHSMATGNTPAMVGKTVGAGSQYLSINRDSNAEYLDGGKNYKLNIAADVPVNNFWSIVVYDSDSRSMMITDQDFPSVNSLSDPDMNADGSTDIYFSPTAPAGKENNWIQTLANKGWAAMFRFYGPLEPYFDQTWKLGDIERLD